MNQEGDTLPPRFFKFLHIGRLHPSGTGPIHRAGCFEMSQCHQHVRRLERASSAGMVIASAGDGVTTVTLHSPRQDIIFVSRISTIQCSIITSRQ
eukprot:168925-Amphidinium_carterae.2